MNEQTEPTVTVNNAFGRLLSEHRNGQSLADLGAALQECVRVAIELGKPAVLQYVGTINPIGNGAVTYVDAIKTKLPEPERPRGIFFATEDHRLQRSDPAQRELSLREVEKPPIEIKEITVQPMIVVK